LAGRNGSWEIPYAGGKGQIWGELAVAVKASGRIHRGHTRGLKALQEDYSIGRVVIVSLEKQPRRLDSSIEVLPWQRFVETLWSGGFGL
jgi:hypothetical protein